MGNSLHRRTLVRLYGGELAGMMEPPLRSPLSCSGESKKDETYKETSSWGWCGGPEPSSPGSEQDRENSLKVSIL